MRGFLEWFKPKSKMKRWMLLILIGIFLVSYGIAQILIMKELSLEDIIKTVVSFVVGFVCIILSIIGSNKRMLELIVESSDSRINDDNKNVNVKSLIFNKTIYEKGPKIVVIGGGSGLNAVLKGIKKYTNNVTGIIAVSDYGEMPSISRMELNAKPLDDIEDGIVALAKNEESMKKLIKHNFYNGRLNNLSFGDIYLSAMQELYKDTQEAVLKTNEVLDIVGKILPVTLDEIKICAELRNGIIVEEKSKIPEVVYEKITKINRVYISPSNARVAPGVLEAIQEADCIIIGPGSLYTNVIPSLLVNGVSKTIKESKALKLYISNIMTQPGQTDNYSLSEHIDTIIAHAGREIMDYCICDTGEVVPEYVKKYNKEGSELVEYDKEKVKKTGIKLIARDLSCIEDEKIRHDSDKIARTIIEIVCDDLKYKDRKNDPEYLMISNKLKTEKKYKKRKPKKNKEKNIKNKEGKRNSKFNAKYKDRIDSIKTSDKKTIENRRKANQGKVQEDNYYVEKMREKVNKQKNESQVQKLKKIKEQNNIIEQNTNLEAEKSAETINRKKEMANRSTNMRKERDTKKKEDMFKQQQELIDIVNKLRR